jgi:hypothetical protein
MNRPAEEAWDSGHAYEQYVGRWSRKVATEFLRWLAVSPTLRRCRWRIVEASGSCAYPFVRQRREVAGTLFLAVKTVERNLSTRGGMGRDLTRASVFRI